MPSTYATAFAAQHARGSTLSPRDTMLRASDTMVHRPTMLRASDTMIHRPTMLRARDTTTTTRSTQNQIVLVHHQALVLGANFRQYAVTFWVPTQPDHIENLARNHRRSRHPGQRVLNGMNVRSPRLGSKRNSIGTVRDRAFSFSASMRTRKTYPGPYLK